MSEDVAGEKPTPTIQVTGGNPSDDELAAALAVLAAATAPVGVADSSDDRPLAGGWKSYHRVQRRFIMPGREAWRYSARPW